MAHGQAWQKVPGHRADYLLQNIRRFRKAWSRHHRPDDVNRLLRIFPHISLQRGYTLDYIPMGGAQGGWIWPYARRDDPASRADLPPQLAGIPRDLLMTLRESDELRRVEVETLYSFVQYDRTPEGLFEYAFFISELWATKSSSKASEWLNLEPLLTRWQFDSALRQAGTRLVRVARPEVYDPLVLLDAGGGGEVRFLASPGDAWKRIVYYRCHVERDGRISREVGDLVANLG